MGNKFVLYTWTNYIYEDEIKLKQTLKVLPKLKKKKKILNPVISFAGLEIEMKGASATKPYQFIVGWCFEFDVSHKVSVALRKIPKYE